MPVQYANVEKQYAELKDLKKEDVQMMMEWASLQQHLPPISELQMILFLNSCYYSNEAAKKCIDNYYTARKLCPEFFANRNPKSEEIQRALKTLIMVPLPKKTPEGYNVYYTRFIDCNPDSFNFSAILKTLDMASSLGLQEGGAADGQLMVYDLEGCTLSHLMKFNLLTVKKFMFYLQDCLPVRLKGFHYVNAVSFMDKLLAIIKPFMKKELLEMLQVHQAPNDTIFKFIPKDCLPCEIGGTLGSAMEIHRNNVNHMMENADYFVDEEKLVADESKRAGKPKNAGDFFGVEGTFKKLDID